MDLQPPVRCKRRGWHVLQDCDTHGHLVWGQEAVGREGKGVDGRVQVLVVRGISDARGTHR